mmetsp:Transcript_20468/g.45958  ORF Transcript_20468/g.45958 Transcript_20468/m.45958 type:complete len:378 (-) Transcript_20468:43-1176(-)
MDPRSTARRRKLKATLLRNAGGSQSGAAPDVVELEQPRVVSLFQPGETSVQWRRLRLHLSTGEVVILSAEPLAEPSGLGHPAILVLHSTGKSKEYIAEHLERFARKGYVAVAFDARYHGERALPGAGIAGLSSLGLASVGPELLQPILDSEAARLPVYHAALVRAWKTREERPFLYDTVADAIGVVDYLTTRPGVIDPARIGVTGVSLGGMHTWLLAAADERVAAAAPAIGVHSFRHAMEKGLWGARVDTIRPVFEAAATDIGRKEVDTGVVQAVWQRLVPGLSDLGEDGFDAFVSLGCVAPRPMLVLSGECDPRCPIEGVRLAVEYGNAEYKAHGAEGKLQLFVDAGVEHEMTQAMWNKIDEFMDAVLLRPQRSAL